MEYKKKLIEADCTFHGTFNFGYDNKSFLSLLLDII